MTEEQKSPADQNADETSASSSAPKEQSEQNTNETDVQQEEDKKTIDSVAEPTEEKVESSADLPNDTTQEQNETEETNKETLKDFSNLKPGMTVKVHQKIQEAGKKKGEIKERIQIFEGMIIAIRGAGISKTMTVRKVSDGIGVEKIFPLHLPTIAKIEPVKQARVRRAKLYYLRDHKKKLKERKVKKS